MSTFASISAAGQAFSEAQMGETFTIGNASYVGVLNFIARDFLLEPQGARQMVDAILVASRSQFGTAPATNDSVVYSNTTYTVRDVQDDTQAYTMQLKKMS